MNVLLIIPAHNEEQNLAYVLETYNQYRGRYDAVVIDDASTDKTAAVARKYKVPVVQLAANMGIGGAVQTGFKYGVAHDYDVVVQLDGDGQHDPAWVDSLLMPISAGEANCVVGSRYMKNNRDSAYRTSLPRRLGMVVFSTILSGLMRQPITDTTSGLRALDRRACEYFARNYSVDHPDAEALLLLHRAGFKIKEVPVTMHARRSGRSSVTFIKSVLYPVRMMLGIIGALLRKEGR